MINKPRKNTVELCFFLCFSSPTKANQQNYIGSFSKLIPKKNSMNFLKKSEKQLYKCKISIKPLSQTFLQFISTLKNKLIFCIKYLVQLNKSRHFLDKTCMNSSKYKSKRKDECREQMKLFCLFSCQFVFSIFKIKIKMLSNRDKRLKKLKRDLQYQEDKFQGEKQACYRK